MVVALPPPRVFISYTHDSSELKKWVQALAQRVRRQGAEVWLDQDQLTPGDRWTHQLTEAWHDAEVALVIFTGRERGSEWSRRELQVLAERARSGRIRLIPILRAGFWNELPAEFRNFQGIDMRDDEQFLASLNLLKSAIFRSEGNLESTSPDGRVDPRAARGISRLRLQNVKLFEDFELDLTDDDDMPRACTCVLADNGCGKTTILQTIALAAVGDVLATKLMDDPRSFAPALKQETLVAIEADFMRSRSDTLRTRLELVPTSHDWFGSGPDDGTLRSLRSTRRDGFFIAAYGGGRRLARAGQVAVPADPVMARMRSLFDSGYQLLGLEFGDALREPAERHAFLDAVNELLAKPVGGETLLPGVLRIALAEEAVPGAGRGDVAVTLDLGAGEFQLGPALLSSGYQAVLAWLGELLGHMLLDFGPDVLNTGLRGIVLIDELDQHLHPTWQRRIVPILRTLFPDIQFVVTTHSPLVLTGFSASEIIAVELEDGRLVQRREPLPEPGMQSGSQLYSSFFQTPIAARPGLEEKEREFLSLHAQARQLTTEQKVRMSQLEKELEPFWDAPLRDPATTSDAPSTEQLRSILKQLEGS